MHLKAFYHLQKAVDQVKKQDFDIVHTHLSSASDMYIFPLTTAPGHRVGDADRYYMEWSPYIPMVAISESARAQEKLPLNFVGVVHNGIDMSQYRPTRKQRGDFFAWLGRFAPEKGPHLAIEAAKQANVPLVLAGTIDRYVKDSISYFHKAIEPEINDNQVKYLGPVNMRKKLNLLSRARGFLNPIEWEEPFGIVMIEAMAVGCPVISFTRGAAPEIVAQGETGFLVQDLDEMVQYIPRIDEIDRERTRLYVEHNFSARVMAEKYTQVYEKVIAMSKEVSGHKKNDATRRKGATPLEETPPVR